MNRPNGRALIVKLELVTGIALAMLAVLTGLGLAMAAIGAAWMVRIARTDPDRGGPGWRYRDH